MIPMPPSRTNGYLWCFLLLGKSKIAKFFPIKFTTGIVIAEIDKDKIKVRVMIIEINSYFATY